MSGLRNRSGRLAVVVPFEGAAVDVKVHGGKVVTPLRHGACGLGPDAWSTEPTLYDGFGNALAWDDGLKIVSIRMESRQSGCASQPSCFRISLSDGQRRVYVSTKNSRHRDTVTKHRPRIGRTADVGAVPYEIIRALASRGHANWVSLAQAHVPTTVARQDPFARG
jgi:hypothetical protein